MKINLDATSLIRKRARVQGIAVGHRRAFEEMNRAIEIHGLRPVIDRCFPFADVREAFDYLDQGAFGKIVIRVFRIGGRFYRRSLASEDGSDEIGLEFYSAVLLAVLCPGTKESLLRGFGNEEGICELALPSGDSPGMRFRQLYRNADRWKR